MAENKTIKVCATESYCSYMIREDITINVDDYPELEGMTDEEITEYIESNSENMFKKDDEEKVYSLWDEMMEQDIVRDKITGEEFSVIVEIDDEE
jgi:pentatricopeptide repeat protein